MVGSDDMRQALCDHEDCHPAVLQVQYKHKSYNYINKATEGGPARYHSLVYIIYPSQAKHIKRFIT
jgi:hypothetical protein